MQKEMCSICGKEKKVSKMRCEEFQSKLHPDKPIKVWTCKACLGEPPEPKEVEVTEEEIEKAAEKLFEPEPLPQLGKSDENPEGFVHRRSSIQFISTEAIEKGKINIDPSRLKYHVATTLGADLLRVIQKITGHKCHQVKVISIELEYVIRIPERG